MYKVLNATYNNNSLILDEKHDLSNGMKVKVIILDDTKKSKEKFLNFVRQNKINMPKNFNFIRDEINER
jgi:predicted DNA-binding antitoxin AbrB/MazE fold protein